jgi:hypothetical protein
MGNFLNISRAHRQYRLAAMQGLYLTFFINAQLYGFGWSIQIQTDNIAHFLNEKKDRLKK